MKNKFIGELAHKLLLVASFEEMKGVLEDYTGFMSEAEIHEKPKDVVRSLEIDKRKGYISSIIYFALLVISFFAMNSIRRMGWNMFVFFSIVLLLLCIMVLFSTYFLWGKKLSLVSQYSDLKIKDSFGAVVLSIIPLIIIVGFSLYIKKPPVPTQGPPPLLILNISHKHIFCQENPDATKYNLYL